jgi:hypothetical protein
VYQYPEVALENIKKKFKNLSEEERIKLIQDLGLLEDYKNIIADSAQQNSGK